MIKKILILIIIATNASAENLVCPQEFTNIQYKNAQICVTRDYWFEDGIRMPYNANEAEMIAKKNNSVLPTKKIVDLIWDRSDLKLTPQPKKPTKEMTSLKYAIEHNNEIEKQINNKEYNLVSGHKKDILQRTRQDRVTVYGWHYRSGKAIQPVSTIHGWDYKDYSHGTRLIHNKAMLNNKIVNINKIISTYDLK